MRAIITALALTAALAVAGCGSSYSSGGSSSTSGSGTNSSSSGGTPYGGAATTPSSSSSSSSGAAGGSGTVQVTLQNIAFNPSSTTAKVGQTVKWTNRDSTAHNVTATKGEGFRSKTLNQGDTYSYKLDKPGTITYVCTFHPGMQATIVVKK